MALLKSAPELLASGHDLVSRGDLSGALQRYTDAANKFNKTGDATNAALANAYAAVMTAGQRGRDPAAYRFAAQTLRGLGNTTLKLGLREASAAQLATEADLLAEELELSTLQPTNPDQYRQKAQYLQGLSIKFRTRIGDQVLTLPELFRQGSIRGTAKALPLAAQAEEASGEALITTDPKSAAEHYQSARLWWTQAGYSAQADSASARVRAYGRSAKCWFCGREVAGEGVHFVPMPSDLSEVVRKSGADSVLATHDPVGNTVYACRGCYNAVYKLADQLAVQRMNELEMRVQFQISEVRKQIASLNARINAIRR